MHDTTYAFRLAFRPLSLTFCLLLSAAAANGVSAQSSTSDKALAESLFDRGLELMKLGKDEEACQTLERSHAVEPGVGTMLYLAECYEKLGRSASAWAMYREAASLAQEQGQSERAKKGATRAEHLQATLSKLTLAPPNQAIPGLLITRNGNVVPAAALNVPVPVDPGEQKLTAAAPGYVTWNTTVDLPANGARLVVDVPALQQLPPSEVPPSPLVAQSEPTPLAPAAAPSPPTAASSEESRATFHKPLAYVLGGVGIVTLGVGSYFGIRAISENGKAEDECATNLCSAQGITHDESARSAATAANVLVASGLALVAASVVIYLVRPREDSVNVALSTGPGSAQLKLQGSF